MDDDAALLYDVSLDLHTCRSNAVTASSGVDGLNRLILATPEQYPVAPPQATMRRVLFAIVLFWVVLVGGKGQTFANPSPHKATIVSKLPAASVFTNVYGIYGTNFITIAPWTSQGIFYQGDAVTISNSIGTTIEVYDFHSNHITNAAPPVVLTNLGLGHYFVQVDGVKGGFGDRAQFSIWPRGYTNYLHADIGLEVQPVWLYTVGAFNVFSNRSVRISPSFTRVQISWAIFPSNQYCSGVVTPSGTNDWTYTDELLWNNSNVPTKVLNFNIYHPDNLAGLSITNTSAPLVDITNSLSSWVNDVASLFSNVAAKYLTNYIYEILNEPGSDYVFSNDSYIGSSNVPAAYPASLAVSASVQAIRSACPACQTWAPAAGGMEGSGMYILTNAYVVPGYTNVDMLSFHNGIWVNGPVDTINDYTNRTDLGLWWPSNSNTTYVANIYHKEFAVTEAYPMGPDVLGRTNSWWISNTDKVIPNPGWRSTCVPNWSWNWYTMTMRWWKSLLMWRFTGVSNIQMYEACLDAFASPSSWLTSSNYFGDPSSYVGWGGVTTNDSTGCGPRPSIDGLAMVSWWLTGATPLASWLSGNAIVDVDPLGGYVHGPPGLHFWTWRFANGTTNTFIWADEQITVTTNFGVGLTDIFSNQWNGPIGIEPVIAWGWPNNSLGGAFSIVPMAAFNASPTYGPVPMTVTFTDDSAGAITNRSWQFGDGFVTNTTGITVAHRYTRPGSNTVQLIVNGPSGASSNVQSNMVIVTPFPPPLNGGGINGFPPVTGGNAGGTNNVSPADGGANNNWRLLITY